MSVNSEIFGLRQLCRQVSPLLLSWKPLADLEILNTGYSLQLLGDKISSEVIV